MKRESSRAVIIEDNKVLTIFRRKIDEIGNTIEYYVIPGGGIDGRETPEETVIRELKEELNVEIELLGFLKTVEKENTIENYFAAKIVSGTPHMGGEEVDRSSIKNYYEPMYMEMEKLRTVNFQGMDVVTLALNKEYK